MTKKELLEKRANLVEQARAIQDAAAGEKREMTAEESANFDAYIKDAHDVKTQIDDLQKGDDRRASLAALELSISDDEKRSARGKGVDPSKGTGAGDDAVEKAARQERAFRAWIAMPKDADEDERRALQADLDTVGGFTVPPPQFQASLIEAVRNAVLFRTIGDVMPLTSSDAIVFPTLEAYPEDPDWTAEIQAIDLDTQTAFGKREFTPHKLTKAIVVSEKLLAVSALPIESLVRDLMVYKFATTEESNFMTGTGAGRPLGVFTASTSGISTGRDVSTGNTTTSIQFDGLISARGTLKPQYLPRASWLFHRDGVTQVSKLKDGNGQYLWQPSVQAGKPDMLLGHPLYQSEYAPNTFTTGLYVGMIADFSKYRIVDFGNAQVTWKRHTEYLAGVDLSGTDQVGFSARKWTDGGPVIEEAFVRVKLA